MRDGKIPDDNEFNILTNADYRTNVLIKSKIEATKINGIYGAGINRYSTYEDLGWVRGVCPPPHGAIPPIKIRPKAGFFTI
jgi:hypothetical protein